jgi:hypothetical protein
MLSCWKFAYLAALVGAQPGMGGMPPGMGGMPPGMGGMPPGMGGMPPGMGGMPPGMGGGPPPPPMEISLKDARRVLKEIVSALKQEKSGAAIQQAMTVAAKNPQMAQIKDPQQMAQMRMQTLAPVLQQITGSVVAKYGFKGGFMEAMASISKHAEKDPQIASNLSPLRSLLTGAPPAHLTVGKIPEFDKLAFEFATAEGDAGRTKVIENAKKELERQSTEGKLKKPLAKFYLKIMEKSMPNQRVEYVIKETERLIKLVSDKNTVENMLKYLIQY